MTDRLSTAVSIAHLSLCLLLIEPVACSMDALQNQSSATEKEYVISLGMSSAARHREEARVRQQLWGYFDKRQIGSFKVTWFSKEGEPSINEFTIKPDEAGIWRITVHIERHLRERGGPKRHGEYISQHNYVASKLLIADMYGSKVEEQPTADLRFFETHKVRLADESGKVLQEI